MRSVSLITFALMLALPLVAAAQFGDLGSASNSFSMSASPQFPAPLSEATLSFLSSSLDLTSATLIVSADGTQIHRGSVRPVTVTLGRAGSVTEVVATILAGGASYTKSLTLVPQDIVLIAEPIASAPPLYRGKPSVPLEGNVRVVAIANLRSASGAALDPSALSYAWTVDGASISSASGIGKSALMVASPLQFRARSVSVVVASAGGSAIGGAELSLSAVDPAVRLYESDPLLGIRFDRALGNSLAIDAEAALYAAPFSFPTSGGTPLLEWFLNGARAQTGPLITLRPSGSGAGQASLSLVATAGGYTKAAENLSLSFGSAPGFNLFGL